MADVLRMQGGGDAPDPELDAFARRVGASLREQQADAVPDADFTARVIAAVRADVRPETTAASSSTLAVTRSSKARQFRSLRTPMALAATVVVAVFGARELANDTNTSAPTPVVIADVVSAVRMVEFELRAPANARVAVVGAFNGWDTSATPLVPSASSGDVRWTVRVPLASGQHEYAFVVNGTTWVADPKTASILDEFGTRTSLMVVEPSPRSADSA